MTCGKKLASFPNSRIRTRRPTDTAQTYHVDVQVDDDIGTIDTINDEITETDIGMETTNGNTIIAEANPLTTYITLRNIDPAEPMFYGYVDPGTPDDQDLSVDGQLLRAGDSVDLEVIGSHVIAISLHSDGISPINARIDRGIG